jgi:two-component system chemotaxis sensor kinase CheA
VRVGDQVYAVPQVSVREVLQVDPAAVVMLENNELLPHRDGVMPLLRLADHFGLAATGGQYVLVTGEGSRAVGVVVDRVLGLREVVVRPLTDPLVRVPGIAGATELGDGRVVLILDAAALSRAARQARTPGQRRPAGVRPALAANPA